MGAEVEPWGEGRRVLIVPVVADGAALPAVDDGAPEAAVEVGSYIWIVLARRAKLDGAVPGPRRGGSKYRPSKVG